MTDDMRQKECSDHIMLLETNLVQSSSIFIVKYSCHTLTMQLKQYGKLEKNDSVRGIQMTATMHFN